MLERVITFITNDEPVVLAVLGIGLVFLFFFANLTDRRLSWFSTLVLVLALGAYGGYLYVPQISNLTLMGYGFVVWLVALFAVAIILQFLVLIAKIRRKGKMLAFHRAVPMSIYPNIYGYLNKRGKMIETTKVFESIFEHEDLKWDKNIGLFMVDEEEISFKEFKKIVKEQEGELRFKTLPNHMIPGKPSKKSQEEEDVVTTESLFDERLPLKVTKQPITIREKVIGYALVASDLLPKKQAQPQDAQMLTNWFDILNEPIMYYDNDKEVYMLSKAMMKLLKQEHITLSPNSFSGLIVLDDLPVYSKRVAGEDKVSKYMYRVKTLNGVEWFEESMYKLSNQVYDIVRRAKISNLKYKFLSKTNLIEDIKRMTEVTDKFSLVVLSLNSVLRYNSQGDSDLVDILISKYFNRLNETTLKGKHKVYKLGNIEYAVLFSSVEEYDTLVRDLSNNISDFLNLEVFVNEIRYKMENSLGIVSGQAALDKAPEAIIKAGFDALYLATDPKYPKRFSIYFSNKTGEKSYRFEDLKIDLDDNLDDYLR